MTNGRARRGQLGRQTRRRSPISVGRTCTVEERPGGRIIVTPINPRERHIEVAERPITVRVGDGPVQVIRGERTRQEERQGRRREEEVRRNARPLISKKQVKYYANFYQARDYLNFNMFKLLYNNCKEFREAIKNRNTGLLELYGKAPEKVLGAYKSEIDRITKNFGKRKAMIEIVLKLIIPGSDKLFDEGIGVPGRKLFHQGLVRWMINRDRSGDTVTFAASDLEGNIRAIERTNELLRKLYPKLGKLEMTPIIMRLIEREIKRRKGEHEGKGFRIAA